MQERAERLARARDRRTRRTATQILENRQTPNIIQPSLSPGIPQQQQAAFQAQQTAQSPTTVSYTHLTLPTILLV